MHSSYVKIDAVEVSKLQTLYIDVYFLLNFTVDFISAFFALRLSKLGSSLSRLIVFSALLSLFSVLIIFIDDFLLLKYALSIIVLLISSFIIIYGVSFKRRVKYILSFIFYNNNNPSTIKTLKQETIATVVRLFPFKEKIPATAKATIPEITFPVTYKLAGKVMAANTV